MSIITIAKFLIQDQTVPFCKLEKGALIQMDLLRDQSAAPLTPQQTPMRGEHCPNVQACGPWRVSFQRLSSEQSGPLPPSGQTPGQWPQQPHKTTVPLWVCLMWIWILSLSIPPSERRFLSAQRTDPFTLPKSQSYQIYYFDLRNISVIETRLLCASTMSTSPNCKQN